MEAVIYKIESPNGRVYIGQSVNFKKRLNQYRLLSCKKQKIIYRSFLKYGYINHSIEIIEVCKADNLNEREIYWIDFYKSNKNRYRDGLGMNLTDGGNGSTGYKHSKECIESMIFVRQNISDETRHKMSVFALNKPKRLIIKMDLEGNILKELQGIRKAFADVFGEDIPFRETSSIPNALRGRNKTAYGFKWAYKDKYSPDNEEYKSNRRSDYGKPRFKRVGNK